MRLRIFGVFIFTLLSSSIFSLCAMAQEEERIELLLSPIPPLVMNKGGNDSGYLWDLANLLKHRVNENYNCSCVSDPQILPWKRAYNEMRNEKSRFMLQMARSNEREEHFHWISPTTILRFAFVSKGKPSIDTLEQAHSSPSIAVYRGSSLESYLRRNGFDKKLQTTNDSNTSARLLNANRVHSWFASVQEALWLRKNNVLKTDPVIGRSIMEVPVWIVASKNTPKDQIKKIYDTFAIMEADGTMTYLKVKYGLYGR